MLGRLRSFQRGTVGLVGHLAAKLQTVNYNLSNLEDDPIVWESYPGRTRVVRLEPGAEFFVKPPTLTACIFAAS